MKNCRQCQNPFEIREEDRSFYSKIDVPEPTLCITCRQARRWAQRNERKLYYRKCDFSGEEMISLYSPENPYKAYKEDIWWSDTWDPMEYSREFDFTRPFFEQFEELRKAVPRRGMQRDGSSENCDYTTFGLKNKNCYLAFGCFLCEEVYFSTWIGNSKNCIDCLKCSDSELLYECIDCQSCYNCKYCQDCLNCHDSLLLDNCSDCDHCIACKNLRNKSYHIYNQPVSKEEFELFKQKLENYQELQKEKEKFEQWKFTLPFPHAHAIKSEDSDGNYLEQTKNCYHCFDMFKSARDCYYSEWCGLNQNDTMDCSSCGSNAELLYECYSCADSHHLIGCASCRNSHNLSYCDSLSSSSYCFGSVGLRHKNYCILNKQYTKKEYLELSSKIIEHMKKNKEWGEFFPTSPFAYNETIAQERYPLSKDEVLHREYRWQEEKDEVPNVKKVIPAQKLPDRIDDIPDDVLNWAVVCETTESPFLIIKQELAFYRKTQQPIPHLHPDIRHQKRVEKRIPWKLWNRQCQKCQASIKTSYAPERPEIIYCEKCYLEEIK